MMLRTSDGLFEALLLQLTSLFLQFLTYELTFCLVQAEMPSMVVDKKQTLSEKLMWFQSNLKFPLIVTVS